MNMKQMLYTLWQKKVDKRYFDLKTYEYTNLPSSAGNYEVQFFRVFVSGNIAYAFANVKALKTVPAGTNILSVTLPTIPAGTPNFIEARSFGWNDASLVIGSLGRNSLMMRPLIAPLPANQTISIGVTSVVT